MERCYSVLTIHLLLSLLTLSSFSLAAIVATNKTDLSALLSFKSQIHDDPFGVLSSWNESLHHCQWQGILCGLHYPDRVTALVLDSKQLSGYISPSLANLTFLQRLSLSDNQLRGSIPVEVGYLGRLHFVNLSLNFLNGGIPSTLSNCSNLEVISLRNNNLHGNIPSNLAQCKELKNINLGNNFLTGGIPLEFGLLPQLQKLELYANNLIGSIPSTMGNLSSLIYLYLDQNIFYGNIPDDFGKLTNLSHLYLSNNNFVGSIPPALGNLTKLALLSLHKNSLSGHIPPGLGNLTNILELHLYENKLYGSIPYSLGNLQSLTYIDFSKNTLSGFIPDELGKLQNLQYININSNQLEVKISHDWNFMDSLTNCTSLQILDLSNNQLQGVLPSSITNLSTSLLQLSLSSNPISGSIPTELRKLNNLNMLDLGNMFLSGSIPVEIGNLFKLGVLHLENNMISGQIPSTIANLTQMSKLYLDNNVLEGSIPPDLSSLKFLELMNISNNKLVGEIPKEIMGLPSLSISLDLSQNYLSGILSPEIGNLKNLQSIRLSNNKLGGEIPSTIDGCQVLQALYLDSNLLQGTIPNRLGNLRGLQTLDVSNNSLSGRVPEFLGTMNLQFMNISFNNFEGELPKEGIFKNASGLDVRGNPKLCGGVPQMHLSHCLPHPSTQRNHFKRNMVLISSIVASFICMTVAICLLVTYYTRNNPQSDRDLKYGLEPVSYNALLRATENFSLNNLIGRGTFGEVYKAVMSFENVTTVAVKVLNLEKHNASRSFFSECETLTNVRHRNLIKVLSLCSSRDHQGNDFKALVFEFMPNGSLASWLHPNACTDRPLRSLNFIQRLNIAFDVASALDYLHYHLPVPIVHCDLKPSNVLLDDDMTAHVSDFGLARFLVQPDTMPSQSMSSTCGIKGSIGYIPPEYGMGGRPTVEGDVYSYGVLLLELFTGVCPIDERIRDGLSLQKQVEMAFPNQVMDIVDPKLFSETDGEHNLFAPENVYSCLVLVIQCGLMCSKESPKERISIKDVTKELNSARTKVFRP